MDPKNNGQHKCPVCGEHTFPERDSYDICPICGWEDDAYMENHPDDDCGANNGLSLNEYKKKFESGWRPEWIEESEGE